MAIGDDDELGREASELRFQLRGLVITAILSAVTAPLGSFPSRRRTQCHHDKAPALARSTAHPARKLELSLLPYRDQGANDRWRGRRARIEATVGGGDRVGVKNGGRSR